MLNRRFIVSLMAMSIALSLSGAGCLFSPDKDTNPPGPEPEPIPAPTTPDNLLKALKVIYNDKVRSATERRIAYENLLSPDFIFYFQPVDYDSCGCQDWGRDEDIQSAANIFQQQDDGLIYSLRLDLQYGDPTDIDPPDPNKPGWKRIFVSNVFLELLRDPNNGFVVNGGQAEFEMQPLNNRWYIARWRDLPRP